MSDSFTNPSDTTISCDQLSNFINEVWMDVTRAESVQEIEIKIDLLEKNFGKSLAPCVGYEVLNNKTEDYDSVSRILSALKKDSKERVRDLAHEGAHYEGSEERMTTNQIDLLNRHIDQIGKDIKDRCGIKKSPLPKKPPEEKIDEQFDPGLNQYEMTSTDQY